MFYMYSSIYVVFIDLCRLHRYTHCPILSCTALLYQGLTGEYKVHEQLSLNELEASDVDDPLGCSLYIQHPTKSFVIVCESVQSKTFWLRDIRQVRIVPCNVIQFR